MARFKITGINDARDYCECCGKSGLKRVVWIYDTETGDEKHFGTSCASSPAKGFNLDKEIKAAVRSVNSAMKYAWASAARRYRASGGTYINSKDKDGSPIAKAADMGLWNKFAREEESNALSRLKFAT